RQLAPPRDDRPALPARGVASGAPVWVVAELGPRGPKPVTAELLAKAAELAARLGAPVEALVLGDGAQHAGALAAAGADRVLVAEGAGLVPYTTDAHAAALAEAIRARAPRLVLVPSTARGRTRPGAPWWSASPCPRCRRACACGQSARSATLPARPSRRRTSCSASDAASAGRRRCRRSRRSRRGSGRRLPPRAR